jgi:hypothetical protein
MPPQRINELKKSLMAAGFQVYRTVGHRIVLADRVRDNLIMDSGVAVVAGESLAVQLVMKAQARDFPDESEEALFGRARALAGADCSGYEEVDSTVVAINDPGNKSRTLDTWYEVIYHKPVSDEGELFAELHRAFKLPKTAKR